MAECFSCAALYLEENHRDDSVRIGSYQDVAVHGSSAGAPADSVTVLDCFV